MMNSFEKIALKYIEKLKTHTASREIKDKHGTVIEFLSEIIIHPTRIELKMPHYYPDSEKPIVCVTAYPFDCFYADPEDLEYCLKRYTWKKR